jgi:leucyl/phenylalanyl-tRNA--protein transferase
MSFVLLGPNTPFPDPSEADPDGLIAMGVELTPERLLQAYHRGIFPWYESLPILWWCPDPRFVLFPGELKKNKTVTKMIRANAFDFTINRDFPQVIHHCRRVSRPGQEGMTWITDEMEKAYTHMHALGYAHSAEVWKDGELAGGLYGIRLGNVFFGESMFSLVSNASRYAFTLYVEHLKNDGVSIIDCQMHSDYLESLGARFIRREEFLRYLPANLEDRLPRGNIENAK